MLFNYFTQKLVDFEMNVLKIPTFELALSNLLLCENLHPVMPQGWVENGSRIYASKMPVRYFSNKSYLQSLLFVVCMWDIDEKSGKHLLFDVFNNFSSNRLGFFDWELQQQISGFYKIAYPSEGNLLPPELLPCLNRLNLEKYKNSFFKGDEYKRPQEAINARHFLAERFQIQKENA